jgi:hypothetical protein
MPTEISFTPPKGFKPMTSFNPAEPALLFDDLNQKTSRGRRPNKMSRTGGSNNGSFGWDGLYLPAGPNRWAARERHADTVVRQTLTYPNASDARGDREVGVVLD